MRRFLPHPLLTVAITLIWVLLANGFSIGILVLGLLLGIAIPFATQAYWPGRPRIRRPFAILGYVGIVVWDIVLANLQVAYLILFKRGRDLRSHFLTVPLELDSPEAITLFAGTITMTPGTVSADLSADGRALLVHCLDTDDPDGAVLDMKNRYERRLKEIFE